MIEFKFINNVLNCGNSNTTTAHYSDFIREIYNCTNHYDKFERFEIYDIIDTDLKIIIEQYDKKEFVYLNISGSIYGINSITCKNKDIQKNVIEQLNAYIVMKKLIQ